jgi:tRNA(His) 5'-end guanylyltransferase
MNSALSLTKTVCFLKDVLRMFFFLSLCSSYTFLLPQSLQTKLCLTFADGKGKKKYRKLATTIATTFSVEYCMQWDKFFPGQELDRPFPTFDGRCVLYPKRKILRDYLSWRQADCKCEPFLFFLLMKRNKENEGGRKKEKREKEKRKKKTD